MDAPPTRAIALAKKTIFSLIDLREILSACIRRYPARLSALDDFSAGVRALDPLTKPRSVDGKIIKGVNFFDLVDNALLHALENPKVNIAGVTRRSDADARPTVSRHRLREIGVIKKVVGSYRYYLTKIGRAATGSAPSPPRSSHTPATRARGAG